jgi:predicted nuclease of restriction endonuclease-like (RecB) superfamily
MKFAEVFPDFEIVATLWRQLSWNHFKVLIAVKEPLAREFYGQMAITDNWSVRTLSERVDSMLFERTALSKKPEELIEIELNNLAE